MNYNIQELVEKQKYILQLEAKCTELEKEVARLKTVPMIYRRIEFNAQLQDENNKLIEKCNSLENSLEQTSITLGEWIAKCAEWENKFLMLEAVKAGDEILLSENERLKMKCAELEKTIQEMEKKQNATTKPHSS